MLPLCECYLQGIVLAARGQAGARRGRSANERDAKVQAANMQDHNYYGSGTD
jgi:hypothetical protein